MVTGMHNSFDRGPPRVIDQGLRGGPRGAPGHFAGEKGGAPAAIFQGKSYLIFSLVHDCLLM
jgi:hypothetical protein